MGLTVRLLRTRWEGVAELGWIPLATLPTDVERLPGVSRATGAEVWCKRDDRTAAPYGGNKVRKLEWLLGDARARGCDVLVTTGAYGSHHVLATAIYGRQQGFDVHAIMVPQPWSPHVEEQLRADLKAGAQLHPVRSYPGVVARMAAVATRLRLAGKRPFLVGPGGSSPVGALGYVEAGLELARQIDAGEIAEPDAIYIAAGSGGSAAGAAIGLAAAGVTARLVAVRVTDRIAINRATLGQLVRRTVHLLRRADQRFPAVTREALRNLVIDPSQLGPGYGAPTEAAEEAARLVLEDGLAMEPTYTSKAFAALIADAREGRSKRPLFIHTLSSAPMAPLVEGAPPAPEWAARV